MRHTKRVSPAIQIMVLVLTLLASAVAVAGPRDHLDGFFLRLSAGAGSTKTTLDGYFDKYEISGPAGDMNIAIGGIITPNLALHGTLFGWSATDPEVKLSGVDQGDQNLTMTVAGTGVGLTYYFMPVNLYLSGSVGLANMRLRAIGPDGEIDNGLLLDLTVGKEWWVGNKWGLGVAGGMEYHSFGDPDITRNWTGTSWTLRFTATLN